MEIGAITCLGIIIALCVFVAIEDCFIKKYDLGEEWDFTKKSK